LVKIDFDRGGYILINNHGNVCNEWKTSKKDRTCASQHRKKAGDI